MKEVAVREGVPWYDNSLANLKAQRCHDEEKWKKSGFEKDHQTFEEIRSAYNKKMNVIKTSTITDNTTECSQDQHKVYKLVNMLLGRRKDNPLPEHTSDAQLADGLADFFLEKIVKIRSELKDVPNFDTSVYTSESELLDFSPFQQDDVLKILKKTKVTTCKSNPIRSRHILENIDILLNCYRLIRMPTENTIALKQPLSCLLMTF